mgnify:CR=1 FL=1
MTRDEILKEISKAPPHEIERLSRLLESIEREERIRAA